MKKASRHQTSGGARLLPSRDQRKSFGSAGASPYPALPFLLVNMAMTADGKLATPNRRVISFGSKRDLAHLYELRATADAVLSGARTIEESQAKLGPGGPRYQRLRLRRGLSEFPLRIIVSGAASVDPGSVIFQHQFSSLSSLRGRRGPGRGGPLANQFPPIILLTTERAPKIKLMGLLHLVHEAVQCGRREIDFRAAFAYLRKEWKVKRLLCEGGGAVNDALFRAGLVDELHLTICPKICGGDRAPTLSDGLGFARLADAAPLKLVSSKRHGNELFLVFRKRGPVKARAPE